MNELIEKLAKQAGILITDVGAFHNHERGWGAYQLKEQHMEKFAELIVRECAKIADIADESKCEWIGGNILIHFGVEE